MGRLNGPQPGGAGRHPGHPDWLDWSLLASLVAMWGSAFVLAEVALEGFDPLKLTAIRIFIAAAVLVSLMWLSGRRLPGTLRAWGYFALMALIGNCLPFFLITWGQTEVESGLAGILMAVMPLVVLLLAHVLVEGETLNTAKVIGFLAGFAGVVVLMGPEAVTEIKGGVSTLLAQLAILGGAVCYGVNVIVARIQPTGDPLVASAGVMIAASALMLVAILLANPAPLPAPSPVSVISLAVLGCLSTGVATVVYFQVIRRAGPSFLSLINYLIPVWAVVAGALVLGEQLVPRAYLAMLLILSGVLVSQGVGRRDRRRIPGG